MTRMQALEAIRERLETLSDEQLNALADVARAFASEDVIYHRLPASEKAAIEAALDRLDGGEAVGWPDARARLAERLRASKS